VAIPDWGRDLLAAVGDVKRTINSETHKRLESDEVVAAIRPGLEALGWAIESGKRSVQKIVRPTLFGDDGNIRVKQEIDGWHPTHRAVLEVESGRAQQGNAVYRDLVRASLVVDVRYLVLGVRTRYEFGAKKVAQNDFTRTRDLLDSIYASGQLRLPFEGLLLFGW
jgi:hypothetical protein